MIAKIRGEKPPAEPPVEFFLEQRGKYVVLCAERRGLGVRLVAFDPDSGELRQLGGCAKDFGITPDGESAIAIGDPMPYRELP